MERMFSYIPHTIDDQKNMLDALGLAEVEQLFQDIPESVRLNRALDIPQAMPELSLERHLVKLANQNRNVQDVLSFLGAGSYEHYQPSVVDAIISRSEFYTSYTPYQPEISQGMLQAIFEYQTMVADLTGMDIANASMYDGPTAFAEAGLVAVAQTRRNRLVVARTVHPEYRAVLSTYANGQNIEIVEIGSENGSINLDEFQALCDENTAAVMVQYPNFLGTLEDLETIVTKAHEKGAYVVAATYPIALGLVKPPGEFGVDIVVAEGQSLGNAMAYGGPYLGIMAAKQSLMRKLPGRIVGQTTDENGIRGFVLTLQAREQHIRREKATSNICSNQALNALAATVFLSYLGAEGFRELAVQNYHKAHYLRDQLATVPGVKVLSNRPFFNEFVVQLDKPVASVQAELLHRDFLFGYDLSSDYPELGNAVLLTVTETKSALDLDALVSACKEVLA